MPTGWFWLDYGMSIEAMLAPASLRTLTFRTTGAHNANHMGGDLVLNILWNKGGDISVSSPFSASASSGGAAWWSRSTYYASTRLSAVESDSSHY